MGDRYNNHRLLAILILAISGFTSIMPTASEAVTALIALCVTVSGFVAVQPLFWTFRTSYLADSAAAGGIAIVNAFGTLGGFVGPNFKAWADRNFESPTAGHYFLLGITVLGAALMTFVGRRKTASPAEPTQS